MYNLSLLHYIDTFRPNTEAIRADNIRHSHLMQEAVRLDKMLHCSMFMWMCGVLVCVSVVLHGLRSFATQGHMHTAKHTTTDKEMEKGFRPSIPIIQHSTRTLRAPTHKPYTACTALHKYCRVYMTLHIWSSRSARQTNECQLKWKTFTHSLNLSSQFIPIGISFFCHHRNNNNNNRFDAEQLLIIYM